MIFISSTSLKKEIKLILKFFVLSFKQIFWFSVLKRIRTSKDFKKKSGIKTNTLFFSNSNSQFRSWSVFKIISNLSRKVRYKSDSSNGNFINTLSIIFPKGISNYKALDVKIVTKNIKNMKEENIDISFSKKQLSYYRDLHSIDFEIKENVKLIEAKTNKREIAFQIFANNYDSKLIKERTIFLVVDAVSFQAFKESKIYCDFLSESKHFLKECFSPSTVTGSALPSLLTVQPLLTHLMGDYHAMFFSPYLECLPPEMKTLSEFINSKVDYKSAITSFSKTMPFYGYFRGFDRYYNRCSGNNYSPSALDIFKIELIEKKEFFKNFNSQFNFIHDIGGHPPVIPNLSKDFLNSSYRKKSYSYSVDVSLEKVKDIICHLRDSGELDNTNLIITGDHTESYGFQKNNYNLYPKRVSVPLYFRPSKKLIDSKILNWLESQELHTPSTFLLSEIFSNLFDFDLTHPQFMFNDLSWLSSVFEYPKRKYIYNLAFSYKDEKYYSCKVKFSDILNIKETMHSKNINLEVFRISSNNILEIIENRSTDYKRVRESFLKYLLECRKKGFVPIRQEKL